MDTYFHNTMKCFNCYRYGHIKKLCRNNPVCGNCSSKNHKTEECRTLEPKCNNCKGDHKSFDKRCSVYEKETEICTFKTLQNISFPEARKIVEESYNPDNPRTRYPGRNFEKLFKSMESWGYIKKSSFKHRVFCKISVLNRKFL